MRRRLAVLSCHLFVACVCLASPSWARTVESLRDARIDERAGYWRIATGGASMSFTIGPSRDYRLLSIISPTGTNWLRAIGSDAVVTADGVSRAFGTRADGFQYTSVTTFNNGIYVAIEAAFTLQPQNLRVTRHIAAVPGSPTFEIWTTFQAMGEPVAVSNLNAFRALVTPGTVRWLTGQQPDPGDTTLDSVFARREEALGVGRTLTMGSDTRASESFVPWVAVDGAGDEFYSALMWSGAWSLRLARSADGLSVEWSLPPMTTTVGETPIDGPHALVGLARGSLPDATAALRAFIVAGIRHGRPLTPLVTYNTWFAYGTRVDEPSMRREMTRAAEMGVELFVIDAGWWAGADTRNTRNFEDGLGTWEADRQRFPNGLKAMTDYAHALGMKFGVWVEPERVNLSMVGRNGLAESSLATAHRSYESADTAMICLAGKAGRQWIVDRLSALIDAVQPDYLKWDNNLWLNCDREGHGHGASDGNFAHVSALYQVLETLRQKYPSLMIENCSGGGNRLDLGMLRYSDVGWMDDNTTPSVKVRHNIQGLSLIFPPAYLLSFLANLGWEPLHNSPDLPMYVRSRMQGVMGLSFQSAWLTDDDRAVIAEHVALYKTLRPTLADSTAVLLTPQAQSDGDPQWDVLQESADDGAVLLYAFDSGIGANSTLVLPSSLEPGVSYRVVSVDSGELGDMNGADLMDRGIRIVRSPRSAGHVISLRPQTRESR